MAQKLCSWERSLKNNLLRMFAILWQEINFLSYVIENTVCSPNPFKNLNDMAREADAHWGRWGVVRILLRK